MRAIWTGSLAFGLVNIPVKLYSGTQDNAGLDLTMLHKPDLSPIQYLRVCRADGKEVPYEDIVKGYQYQPGDYVVLTDKDFEKAAAKRTKTIEIEEFVKEAEIDVRFFDKSYYLEPDRGADKAYALLREALKKSGKVAIAKFVLRNREHLAAIKTIGNALVLNQLRFGSELRSPLGLNFPAKTDASKKEIDIALSLISHLTEPFVAEDFKDTYVDQLEKSIKAKAKGKPIKSVDGAPVSKTTSKDIMSMLKASLEQEKAKR
jgi:DNA end-binding protein Ku